MSFIIKKKKRAMNNCIYTKIQGENLKDIRFEDPITCIVRK